MQCQTRDKSLHTCNKDISNMRTSGSIGGITAIATSRIGNPISHGIICCAGIISNISSSGIASGGGWGRAE